MPLRVTRQSVEVLREADNPLTANLRVSRQAVEVIRKTAKNLTASSTLAIASTASRIGTFSVSLRAPNLGNKDRLSFNRVLRETRGGTLVVFADPIWPKVQTNHKESRVQQQKQG